MCVSVKFEVFSGDRVGEKAQRETAVFIMSLSTLMHKAICLHNGLFTKLILLNSKDWPFFLFLQKPVGVTYGG